MDLSKFNPEKCIDDLNNALFSFNLELGNHVQILEDFSNEYGSNAKINISKHPHELLLVEEMKKEKSKMKIKIKIVFLKIGLIDTIKDRFSAEVLVATKWREPELDGKKGKVKTLAWEKRWTPSMTISNVVGDVKIITSYNIMFDGNGKAVVCENRKFSGQFYESMELYDFPFDKQDLTICATSDKTIEELDLVEDENDQCVLNLKAFSAEQEWALKDKLKKWNKVTIRKTNNGKGKHPSFCVAAKASRRPQFFIFNVVVILMALCSLCFASFTVSQELVPNRLQLTFTLILTCVTFKFVVSKSLPKISYLTLVDKYILGSMIILIGICFWHAISGSIVYNSYPKQGQSLPPPLMTMPSFKNTSVVDNDNETEKEIIPKNVTICTTLKPISMSSNKPGTDAIRVDKIAMLMFASVYAIFNMFFVVKVFIGYYKSDFSRGYSENDEEKE